MDTPDGDRPKRRWRTVLRELMATGAGPHRVGGAVGLGAACSVAPLPGLQTVVCALVAWRLRVSVPLALIVSNLSFGPLLVFWWALATALGRLVLTGQSPGETYRLVRDGLAASEGMRAILRVVSGFLADWLVGCCLLMVVLGGLGYLIGWLIARRCHRR